MNDENLQKYLPLTEATFSILAVLNEPMHGYALMQKVDQLSEGMIKIGAGTLYGAFATLEKEKLIQMVAEDERRKSYCITAKGRRLVSMHMRRLEMMLRFGQGMGGERDG